MFNVGDTVSINIINSFYDADFRTKYHSKLATVLFIDKYGAGIKTIISGDENYFSFDELIFVRKDAKEPQFKPFDKVLVKRNGDYGDTLGTWTPAIFQKYVTDYGTQMYLASGLQWHECIPYKGNERLVGTTDNPE